MFDDQSEYNVHGFNQTNCNLGVPHGHCLGERVLSTARSVTQAISGRPSAQGMALCIYSSWNKL